MATTKKQMDESIAVLNGILNGPEHNTGRVVHADSLLDATHRRRLREGGFLRWIVDGWYYICCGGGNDYSNRTPWFEAYWDFIAAYLNDRYKDDWVLSADMSLLFRSANGIIPRFLTVRSRRANTRAVSLPFGYDLLIVKAKLPEGVECDPVHGVRLYPLGWALLTAPAWFYSSSPIEAKTCIAMLGNAQQVSETAIAQGFRHGSERVAGALESIGNPIMADEIIQDMRRHGYRVSKQNPFSENIAIPMDGSAISSRVRLMWTGMRPAVLDIKYRLDICPEVRTIPQVLEMIDVAIPQDTLNTLLLQEYNVTEDQVTEAGCKSWDPNLCEDRKQRLNLTAARGYRIACEHFRTAVLDILTGGEEPEHLIRSVTHWHERMTAVLYSENFRPLEDCHGYRYEPSYVSDSEHVPVDGDSVSEAMTTLAAELVEEPDAFVRAVLGHFFILYIHPFRRDNAVMARLFMNSQLLTAGYPWATVPAKAAQDYNKAMEKAKTNGDIGDFAELMGGLVI